jgi:ferredoxin
MRNATARRASHAKLGVQGLRTGIKTTAYPVRRDDTPGVSPGRPRATLLDSAAEVERLVELCPTQAIERQDGGAAINHGRCVHCFRCWRNADDVGADWERGYEWAAYSADSAGAAQDLEKAFGRSLHIRFVDAGACGACMSEARQARFRAAYSRIPSLLASDKTHLSGVSRLHPELLRRISFTLLDVMVPDETVNKMSIAECVKYRDESREAFQRH